MAGTIPRVNAFAIMPWIRLLPSIGLWGLTAIPCVLLIALLFLRRGGHGTRYIILLSGVFVGTSVYYWKTDLQASQVKYACDAFGFCAPTSLARLFRSETCGPDVIVQSPVWDPFLYSNWQLHAPNKRFRVRDGESSSGCLLVAPKEWAGEGRGFKLVECEQAGSPCLWKKAPA
jgi:hypothetical protein